MPSVFLEKAHEICGLISYFPGHELIVFVQLEQHMITRDQCTEIIRADQTGIHDRIAVCRLDVFFFGDGIA